MTGRLALAGWLAAMTASAPPQLPGFLGALSSPLQHYGLWAIVALVFLDEYLPEVAQSTPLTSRGRFDRI